MKRLQPQNPVLAAIDLDDLDAARTLVSSIRESVGGIKLGKEFFTSFGPQGVLDVAGKNTPLFLDLKFHDIPNTVAGAVRSAARMLAPNMLTIHASGGPAMIRAAADAAAEFETSPWILAVTVLTSMDDADLKAIYASSLRNYKPRTKDSSKGPSKVRRGVILLGLETSLTLLPLR